MTPRPAPPAPGHKPGDGRMHEQGIQILALLSGVIRIGRAYTVSNPVFRTQLATLASVLESAHTRGGELVLVALDTDLFLSGVRIPVTPSSVRYQQTVLEALTSRNVTGIRFLPGATLDDLVTFFGLFLGPACPHGAALVQACADARLERIVPAVQAFLGPVESEETLDEAGLSLQGGDANAGSEPESERSGEPDVGAGLRHYAAARSAARTTFMGLANGTVDLRHLQRVVQCLVEGVAARHPVVAGLAGPGALDDYLWVHSLDVCAVAVTMGARLGLDRRALVDLGTAALLHDLGMARAGSITTPNAEDFNEGERARAERHPHEGAKLIAGATTLDATTFAAVRVALEHHHGPGGYPSFPPDWKSSVLSLIVAVADCFVNLHARTSESAECATPYEALGMMLGPLANRFDPVALSALIQAVGFYPTGQRLELSDGSIAVVLAPHHEDPARPHVRLITTPAGRSLSASETHALSPIPATMSVRRALKSDEYLDRLDQAA